LAKYPWRRAFIFDFCLEASLSGPLLLRPLRLFDSILAWDVGTRGSSGVVDLGVHRISQRAPGCAGFAILAGPAMARGRWICSSGIAGPSHYMIFRIGVFVA
jgi:hypothetical protein